MANKNFLAMPSKAEHSICARLGRNINKPCFFLGSGHRDRRNRIESACQMHDMKMTQITT